MAEPVPSVTVIIPARPGESRVKAADAARRFDYPSSQLEVLVARGRQPSVQRNAALRIARGELVYFLDDDSMAPPAGLRRGVEGFRDSAVGMVGGPGLCPADAPWIERLFGLVLGAWLAFGPSRARYAPVGARRESSEKELILCNLLARRASIQELGGFNEALYPNEENALMDELQKRGGKLLYDPEFFIYRRPRPNLGAFAKMLMTYGRGRAEQFRLHPTFGSALNFVPPLFCLYLLSLMLTPWVGRWLLWPLIPYGLALLAQGGALVQAGGVIKGVCATLLVVLTHVLYGAGFWRGLFTPLKSGQARVPAEVVLERIELNP